MFIFLSCHTYRQAGLKYHGEPILVYGDLFNQPTDKLLVKICNGRLPQNQAIVLVDLLRSHTTTPERCFFAIWDGWGAFSFGEPWDATARLHLPDRSYYLMRGTMDAAVKSVSPTNWQSPSLWWPSDRAWCVATEVDLMSTYVGGTADCIEHILGHPRLEAWSASRDDRIDVQGDTVNRQPSKKRGNQ